MFFSDLGERESNEILKSVIKIHNSCHCSVSGRHLENDMNRTSPNLLPKQILNYNPTGAKSVGRLRKR